MLWIGITGPMGSGKSTVAHQLRQMGFEVLDADQVARKVLGPGTPGESEVFRTFGEELRDEHGKLDRRSLGRLVFANPERLNRLEQLIHPLVRQEIATQKTRLERAGHRAAFYDVPLLFEKQMQDQFDLIFVVSAHEGSRLERIQVRSQLSADEIAERVRHHLSAELKERMASAVIQNNGSLEDLKANIKKALERFKIPLPTAT